MKYARLMAMVLIIFTAVILFATVGTVKPSAAIASDWTVVQLTNDSVNHLQTSVSQGRVAWLRADGAIYRVYTQKIGIDPAPVPVNTGDATDAGSICLSGERIVWQENFGGFNIYTKKMGVDVTPQLVSDNTETYDIWPEVSGDRVVWYGSTELYTRKMGTEPTWTLVADNTPVADSVQVSGDRIVWAAYAGLSDQIFTRKIGVDNAPVQLTTVRDHQNPVVSGDRIVWEEYINGYWQLFTQKIGVDVAPIQLTFLPFDSGAAQVSGDRIVWYENYQIFTRKMGVDQDRVLLSSANAVGPRVSGDRVIWWELVEGTYQLIAEDVGSGDDPVQLTTAGGGQAEVDGEYVSWVSNVGDYNQVFVAHAPLTVIKYTVTFNSQGGSAVGSISAAYDTTITAPTAPTRTGYTFGGWYKESSCTNVWTFATDKVTAATTLYAKWVPNTYTIKFNINGGTSGTMAALPMTYNTAKALTTNTYKKNGYVFLGWATSPTGAVVYKDKVSVKNLTATNMATVNLYAKWGAPILTATSYNYTSIKVSWAYAGGATSYRIYRATSAGGSYLLVYVAASTARSWVDTGQTTGKTYYYKVSVVAGGKTYHHSTYKYAKAVPSAPTVTLSKASSTSIKVSWTGVSGATKYQIFRATSATGTYTYLYTASSTARSWVNTGRTPGKYYYYKVRAYHLEGTTKVYGISSAVKYLKI